MKIIPNRKQWKKWALPSKISFLAGFLSILGVILSIITYVIQPSVSMDIEN